MEKWWCKNQTPTKMNKKRSFETVRHSTTIQPDWLPLWYQQLDELQLLNQGKSEAILIASPATLSKTSHLSFSTPGFITSTVAGVRNLGINFDSTLCFESHIKNITKQPSSFLRTPSDSAPLYLTLSQKHSFMPSLHPDRITAIAFSSDCPTKDWKNFMWG